MAIGGIAGPFLFLAAWVISGAIDPGSSPLRTAISRLAAVGAPARPLMTVGLAAFAVGVLAYAAALRSSVPGPAWKAAAATGVATLGVAGVPLGVTGTLNDVHAAVASAVYVSLVAIPLLAAQPLANAGRGSSARLSVATGVLSLLCLVGAVLGFVPGLLQRLGLTLAHVWIIVSAVLLIQRADGPTGDTLSSRS